MGITKKFSYSNFLLFELSPVAYPGFPLDPPLLIVDNLADSGHFIMNQSKSIHDSAFKDTHSHPIHTCFPIIASNVHLLPYCDTNYLQKQNKKEMKFLFGSVTSHRDS